MMVVLNLFRLLIYNAVQVFSCPIDFCHNAL